MSRPKKSKMDPAVAQRILARYENFELKPNDPQVIEAAKVLGKGKPMYKWAPSITDGTPFCKVRGYRKKPGSRKK